MIRKLSATPTAMGTKKLKSESRKHSSADGQREDNTEETRQVSATAERLGTRRSAERTRQDLQEEESMRL